MSIQTETTRSNEQATRQFAVEAARLAANTRCHNVALLDVRGISPVTDYMILATGTSPRQMHTVCNDLEEWAGERGVRAFNSDGTESESWMLIDFVDVVVHVFNQESRSFYDLDSLWGDAKRVEWNDHPATPPPAAAKATQ
jgi:ribosome-associated protein